MAIPLIYLQQFTDSTPFLELSRVFLPLDLLHLLPPKSNVNCTSPLEDYLSGDSLGLTERYGQIDSSDSIKS